MVGRKAAGRQDSVGKWQKYRRLYDSRVCQHLTWLTFWIAQHFVVPLFLGILQPGKDAPSPSVSDFLTLRTIRAWLPPILLTLKGSRVDTHQAHPYTRVPHHHHHHGLRHRRLCRTIVCLQLPIRIFILLLVVSMDTQSRIPFTHLPLLFLDLVGIPDQQPSSYPYNNYPSQLQPRTSHYTEPSLNPTTYNSTGILNSASLPRLPSVNVPNTYAVLSSNPYMASHCTRSLCPFDFSDHIHMELSVNTP